MAAESAGPGMPRVRPLLLIDVDGVLNPLGIKPQGHVPPGFEAHDLVGLRVLLVGIPRRQPITPPTNPASKTAMPPIGNDGSSGRAAVVVSGAVVPTNEKTSATVIRPLVPVRNAESSRDPSASQAAHTPNTFITSSP